MATPTGSRLRGTAQAGDKKAREVPRAFTSSRRASRPSARMFAASQALRQGRMRDDVVPMTCSRSLARRTTCTTGRSGASTRAPLLMRRADVKRGSGPRRRLRPRQATGDPSRQVLRAADRRRQLPPTLGARRRTSPRLASAHSRSANTRVQPASMSTERPHLQTGGRGRRDSAQVSLPFRSLVDIRQPPPPLQPYEQEHQVRRRRTGHRWSPAVVAAVVRAVLFSQRGQSCVGAVASQPRWWRCRGGVGETAARLPTPSGWCRRVCAGREPTAVTRGRR